ncbi:MAG: hypothetical protein HQ546_09460 [Planctomycetes bacterium]|nr:hypothetical protein [Planctomycetota bacterium]
MIPKLPRDAGDRNRTSPFAFTGNKFEFRAVGSSQSIAEPNTVLNTIVAESLDYIATELESAASAGDDLNLAVQKLLSELTRQFKDVLFDGDNYSDKWVQEAKKRGLPNLSSTLDCVPWATAKEAVELFAKYGVYSGRELQSRREILLENYATTVRIEAQTASAMAHTMILPASLRYQKDVAAAINNAKAAGVEDATQPELLKKLVETVSAFYKAATAMDEAIAVDGFDDLMARAQHHRQAVLPAMNALRKLGDRLEQMVDDSYWPLPKYREMLFIR